jgi:hypothetical protein
MIAWQSLLVAWSDNSGYGCNGWISPVFAKLSLLYHIIHIHPEKQFANIKTQSEKWKWKQQLQQQVA